MAADQPPRPDAGSGDGGDRQPQIVVDDPEDFAKTRQLRAIFDARDDYIDARRKANRAKEDGEISYTAKNKRIFRHMQDLALSMSAMLKSHELGREIWNEREYGIDHSFTAKSGLQSFEEGVKFCRGIVQDANVKQMEEIAKQTGFADDTAGMFDDDVQRAAELLDRLPGEDADESHPAFKRSSLKYVGRSTSDRIREDIKEEFRVFATSWGWSVTGLKNLVDTTPILKFSRKKGSNDFHATVPPQRIPDAVFQDLQEFINELGLGVTFDETQQTKIDDDLLDEVDSWRQKNIN